MPQSSMGENILFVERKKSNMYQSTNPLFRSLSDEEEIPFRQWARNNYVPDFSFIEEISHPIVQDECRKIHAEKYNGERLYAFRIDENRYSYRRA
jgi:hypothetical protein